MLYSGNSGRRFMAIAEGYDSVHGVHRTPLESEMCALPKLVFSKSVKEKEHCWSHTLSHHDIFLSYRVACEGKQTPSSSEPSGGIVQMIYERLAVKKKKTGIPIFVYWDKKCLNFGQDWESGFMNGLKTSQLIVLLVSTKTLGGITKAATRQDNVLIEYECALIQNRLYGTPVLPIFLAGIEESGATLKFTPFQYGSGLDFPDLPHARKQTSQQVIDQLGKDLIPEKKEFLGSIKQTIALIFQLQGFSLRSRGENAKDLDDLVDTTVNALHKAATHVAKVSNNTVVVPPSATESNNNSDPLISNPLNNPASTSTVAKVGTDIENADVPHRDIVEPNTSGNEIAQLNKEIALLKQAFREEVAQLKEEVAVLKKEMAQMKTHKNA